MLIISPHTFAHFFRGALCIHSECVTSYDFTQIEIHSETNCRDANLNIRFFVRPVYLNNHIKCDANWKKGSTQPIGGSRDVYRSIELFVCGIGLVWALCIIDMRIQKLGFLSA